MHLFDITKKSVIIFLKYCITYFFTPYQNNFGPKQLFTRTGL